MEPPPEPRRPADPPFGPRSRHMTGDWFGLRPALHDVGIDTNFFYNHHFMSVLDGGRNRGGGKNSATIDWFVTADLERMGLIEGADMLIHVRRGWGLSINDRTGSTQQVNDDADGRRTLYIDQLWYRQHFFDRKLAVQLGYLDYQAIVDRNLYANNEDRQFMNEALDNNPLIPTASMTGLGISSTIRPVNWYSLILGLGDAQRVLYKPGFSTAFHGRCHYMAYMEHGLHPSIPTSRGPLTGNYRFGMVYDPTPLPVFMRPRRADLPQRQEFRGNDYGFYTSFDQLVFREGPDDEQGLGMFFRYAWRHDEVRRFSQFWSAGLSYTGLLPDRDADVLGFGIAQLVPSRTYRSRINPSFGRETIYELYYSIQVTPWLAISPDIQYVNNPGAHGELSHVLVAGVRARVSF